MEKSVLTASFCLQVKRGIRKGCEPVKDCHALTAGENQLVTNSRRLLTEQDQLILDRIYNAIDSNPHSIKGYQDCFDYIRNISEDRKTEGQRYGYRFVGLSAALRQRLMAAIRSDNGGAFSPAAFELNRRILCWEGTDRFDSFVLYMEANREYEKQFYLPRRKQLHVVVEALQDLADRRLDLLAVSLPPGVGKALANDTPILTRNGWKEHGDLVVGDEVVGLDGNFKKVVAVHPKCQLDCLVEFTNGEKIQCHENHEWMVYNRHRNKYETLETKVIEASVLERVGLTRLERNFYMYQLPPNVFFVGGTKKLRTGVSIKSITRVAPKQGNCITVDGDGMYLAGRSMIPTHNTTLAMFFLCWMAGREPQKPMLTGSHNKDFLSGVYGELLRMLAPDGEYLFNDIFPDIKVISTNAKTLMIDLGRNEKDGQRFTTLEFTSVGAGNAGKVRAENLLYCDDLVDGMETALSKDRLDKLWGLYATDLRQRKIGDCPELHIATRWSLHDVIGRLEQMYSGSERARFIVIPAMNENDESNFDYPIEAGFTTQFYREQRSVMDDASWRALYMNEPIEREGQLYPEETLRRYFELPDGEPDAILSVCDTKDRGSDYCVMPIAYRYGEDYYIADMVCDNGTPDVVESRLVMKLLEHKVHVSRFESNSAGGKIAQRVQEQLKAQGGGTKITTKYTTANKETKIIMASGWVKDHCLFADNSTVKEDKEYRLFLRQLTGYTLVGKNKHDDVPDAMAQLYEFAESMSAVKVEVMHSPFRRF